NRYAAERSEPAFAELIQRHVDLVHSAAMRLMNGNRHAAQDVTQEVFTEVARQAKRLSRHPALVGWLYTTTRLMALRMNRTEQRRQAREQEATMMNQLLHDDTPPVDWNRLQPVIEDVMHELDDPDRHAVLLRYFQNKSLNEVGLALNLTENAARMRVDRALEKLRGKLVRHGITTTTAALGAVMAANAVQAAPAGLVAAISAAAVAGSAVPVSTLMITTKTIVMTTLQKTIVTAALAAAVGTGIYAVHQSTQLHGQIQSLEEERALMDAQTRQLQQERDRTTDQLAALRQENAQLKSGPNPTELLKLRGQVGTLQQQVEASEARNNAPASGLDKMLSDPALKEYVRLAQKDKIRSMYTDLIKELKLTPEQTDQFLNLICDAASKSLDRIRSAGSPDASASDANAVLGSQLQALLGDAGMARFVEYSGEIPARTTVTLLNGQLADNPLTAEQSAQLLQIVKAEPYDVTQGITGAPDKAFLGSPADIDNFLQRVTESNQHILQQAGSFLTPGQLAALDIVLTQAIEARKLQAAALIQKH
ncbi:MAG TPA: sigma-70 family RNA polymerase sigma factor, partial [Verrucomicrobiae bacterium]|nr:sigma-70 family RNA polymerase sigma factor [Verrucomicrobiae bacterium]